MSTIVIITQIYSALSSDQTVSIFRSRKQFLGIRSIWVMEHNRVLLITGSLCIFGRLILPVTHRVSVNA